MVTYDEQRSTVYAVCERQTSYDGSISSPEKVLAVSAAGAVSTAINAASCPYPRNVRVNPATGVVYAACNNDNSMVVSLSGTTVTQLTTNTQLPSAVDMAVDSTSGVVYALGGSGTMVSLQSGSVSTIASAICSFAYNVVRNTRTGTIYVACFADGVYAIRGSTVSLLAGSNAQCTRFSNIAVNSLTDTIFAACYSGTASVVAVSGASGAMTTLTTSAQCSQPNGVYVSDTNPAGNVYAACWGASSDSQAAAIIRIAVSVPGGWSTWSTCSVTCGGGKQTRSCTSPISANGGADCSGATQQSCNTQSCSSGGNGGSTGSGSTTPIQPAGTSCSCSCCVGASCTAALVGYAPVTSCDGTDCDSQCRTTFSTCSASSSVSGVLFSNCVSSTSGGNTGDGGNDINPNAFDNANSGGVMRGWSESSTCAGSATVTRPFAIGECIDVPASIGGGSIKVSEATCALLSHRSCVGIVQLADALSVPLNIV
jgi:hypothetical protein